MAFQSKLCVTKTPKSDTTYTHKHIYKHKNTRIIRYHIYTHIQTQQSAHTHTHDSQNFTQLSSTKTLKSNTTNTHIHTYIITKTPQSHTSVDKTQQSANQLLHTHTAFQSKLLSNFL